MRFLNRTQQLLMTVLTLTLVACGGGGGGSGGGGSAAADSENRFITETNIVIPDSTEILEVSDPGGASQAQLSAATYQIVLIWRASNGASFNELLGTGFAVGGDLIATNAHVSGEVLNRARNYRLFGFSLHRASAFRAETGEEVPLLEALIHPSWNGDTRGPDIGLFVARSGLPVALKLASNQQINAIRPGSEIILNGFPGDVFDVLFSRGFTPGLSIPRATLFSGNVQSLQKFDERSVIDQNNPLSIDMIQHSMDTSGGTSGSPILSNGRVVGVHNSGLGLTVAVTGANGRPQSQRITQSTASWGVHVKHLRNLLDEYATGVMEADKRYRLPPDPALLQAAAGGQAGGGQSNNPNLTGTIRGSAFNPESPGATHTFTMDIDVSGNISGVANWPDSSDNNVGERQFILSGSVEPSGRLEVVDNTPEVIPGFRRGLYIGFINPASGSVTGEYYEYAEDDDEIYYFSDWDAQLR